MTTTLIKALYFSGLLLAGLGGLAAAWRIFLKQEKARFIEGGLLAAGIGLHLILGLLALKGALFITVYVVTALASFALAARSFVGVRMEKPSLYALYLSIAAMIGYEAYLWTSLGRPPFQFLGETFLWMSLVTALLLVVTERLQNIRGLGQFTGVLILAFLAFNAVWPDLETKELPPALQSAWFVPHVLVYLLGYGALTLAFVSAAGHLIAARRHPAIARQMGSISYQLVSLGFPFLTAGLVFGAFWGQTAWGGYWSWDPKENWALVTWLVYIMYLHLRFVKGWNQSRSAWFLLAGVVVIFITYLAVSSLPTAQQSAHTYTS